MVDTFVGMWNICGDDNFSNDYDSTALLPSTENVQFK